MSQLNDLALRHGTDKSTLDHGYCEHYVRYMGPRRDRGWRPTLLELGVWEGASLRMWRDWLPEATIVGVDVVDRGPVEGCHVYTASQTSMVQLAPVIAAHAPFDVVVDDASHLSRNTIRSFEILWPHLSPGGLYVVEDLQTSYDEANYGANACADPDRPQSPEMYTAMRFLERLADEVNASLYPREHSLGYGVATVHFHPNICFLEKA